MNAIASILAIFFIGIGCLFLWAMVHTGVLNLMLLISAVGGIACGAFMLGMIYGEWTCIRAYSREKQDLLARAEQICGS